MKNEKELRPVSSFEYALMEAFNRHEGTTKHTEGIRSLTRQEEIQKRDDSLRSQLSKMQIIKPNGEREDVDVDGVMGQINKSRGR